jgi:hypothetical protein
MNTRSGSFLERVIGALTRGSVPIDASQCDGPCVVHDPSDATKLRRDNEADRQSPIRWVSLR